jgi:hypothetical protein
MGYYLFHILAGLAALTLISEWIERTAPSNGRVIRLSWNWTLLMSFAVCVITGFALLTPLESKLRILAFQFHVWGGTTAAWSGLYHTFKRVRGLLT